jgi:WD40 repeat protein
MLSRFDYDPRHPDVLREVWQIDRKGGKRGTSRIGTHYRFGEVCGAAGVLVGLEYRHGNAEPFDALTARSVADGALVSRTVLKPAEYNRLLSKAGLTLAVHPSGRYFAHPDGATVCFRKLSGKAPDPVELPELGGAPAGPKPKPKAEPKARGAAKDKPAPPARACASVAFSPDGAFLLAGRTDGAVTLFDTRTWEPLRTLDWRVGELKAVRFAPDGTRAAAVGTKRKVVVWDVDT